MAQDNSHEIKEMENTRISGRSFYKEEGINCSYASSSFCAPDQDGEWQFAMVKIENVDTADQFNEEIGIHGKSDYFVKSEYNSSDSLSQQIHNEGFRSTRLEENYFEENNSSNHGLAIGGTTFPLNVKQEEGYLGEFEVNRRNSLERDLSKLEQRCYLPSNDEDSKTNLKKPVTPNRKQHKCNFCDYTTNRKTDVQKHRDSVHLNLKQCKCHLCEYATNYKQNLKIHINAVHLNLKPHKCHLCDFASNGKTSLENHVDSVHLNWKRHKCELCDYATNKNGDIKKHKDSVHLNLKQHKCLLCSFSSNRKTSLTCHINTVHLNLRRHKCDLCDYASNRRSDIIKHKDVHHLDSKQ